jgi:hypothetical protein
MVMDFMKDITPEQRTLLTQVYTIERQDNQTSQIVAFAIVAAALTYIVASAAFFLGHCSSVGCNTIPPTVQLAGPLIPLALLSFLTLSVAATIMRAKHVRKLEELLGLRINADIVIPSFHRDSSDIYEVKPDRLKPHLHLLRMSSRKIHPRRALVHRDTLQFIYVPLTLTTYIPTFLVALGYTIAVLWPGAWTWYKWLALIVYLLILVMQVAGLLLPLVHPRFKTEFAVD